MKKKMSINQTTLLIGYSHPKFHDGKEPRVEYYVRDLKNPTEVKRKRIRLSRFPKKEQRFYAKKIINELKINLEQGWHPDKGMPLTVYSRLNAQIERYLKIKEKEADTHQIRKDTIKDIRSKIRIFKTYLSITKKTDIGLQAFNAQEAVAYLDYIFLERNVSAKTYNNYLLFSRGLFNFFIDGDLIEKNPFAKIKLKKLKYRSRKVPVTDDERKRIKQYLLDENKYYLLCCFLVFHSGLRRTEITKLRVEDILINKQVINVNASTAKMDKHRYASMPLEVIQLILELDILSFPSSYFLIGKNWNPGEEAIKPKKLSDTWASMRKKLNLHPQAQFYSLRKSGAIQKSEDKMSFTAIQDFLGHVDPKSAIHYFENHRNIGNEELKKNRSNF